MPPTIIPTENLMNIIVKTSVKIIEADILHTNEYF